MRCRRWRLARQAVAIGQRSLAVRRDVDQKSGPVWLIGFIRASDRCYQILFGKAEVALRFVTKIWESCVLAANQNFVIYILVVALRAFLNHINKKMKEKEKRRILT